MSINHSPKVVTDNLLMYYDQGNTRRSWKGAPTTNLKTNPNFVNGLSGYSSYVSASPILVDVTDFPDSYGETKTVLQCYSAGANGGGGNPGGMAFLNPTLTIGLSYTFSFWARSISHASLGTTYSNQNGSGDNSNFAFGKTITSEWKKYSFTTTSLDLQKTTWYIWTNSFNAIWQYADFQIEQNLISTPFVNGTRTNTQSLVDLTAQNTITTTKLTYNTDGSFSFGGQGDRDGDPTGDYITLPTSLTSTSPSVKSNGCTYSWWSRITAAQPFGQCILFGAGTIAHIEFKNEGTTSPYFRTEAAVENGYSFGTGTIPGGSLVGRWANFTIVFANNEPNRPVRWYHNGELFHTGSMTGGTSPATEYFYFSGIGRATGDATYLYSNSFYGEIPVFQIYNSALNDQEILQNFNALRGRFNI